ncbi:MAG: arginine--tRNA ligase [Candidatus Azambacteria bacterium]|nr:arginine--tRNA ligase [Candidatus Azambacteria bacterium]
MKEALKILIAGAISESAPDFKGNILVEIPEKKENGDYATNVAFILSKIVHRPPQEIAENLAVELVKQKSSDFFKIEAKNGFINFFLSEEHLYIELSEILKKKKKYGCASNPSSLKLRRTNEIHLDFISANPTGPLTMGNGRGGFYGDALANILETRGNKVFREYYVNDRGEQILTLGRSVKLAQGGSSISQTIPANASSVSEIDEENLYKGEYINKLAEKIGKKLNESEAGQKAAALILKTYIKPALKKSGIKFDAWFSEKSLYPSSPRLRRASKYEEIMRELMEKDLIYEKDGATWFKTTQFGDSEDRVLIKKTGDETYFMSDILYHFDKIKTRKFSKAIDIWGADHHGYAPRLIAALKALDIPEDKLEIITMQLVRLIKNGKEFKISKRAGNFITLEELINEVGLDAARFFFLLYSPNTHMDFDIALAKERSQKNPVYYVQYAHARITSILQKAHPTGGHPKGEKFKLLKEKEELNLIKKLAEFPEILNDISKNYEVHRLPRYAMELAGEFHNFYEKHRVINEDKNLTAARLSLIAATKIILANALGLLGISAPDKM